MKNMSKEKQLFAFIMVAGLILRIWGIDFGLPYQFHQDETIVVNHALAYGAGDLNPHFFAIPPLTSYLLFFIYCIFFGLGSLAGFFVSTEEFALSFMKDPTFFYLIGRMFIGVIPGVSCVVALYHFLKKFVSTPAALYSMGIMSLCFINVVNSHYIYTDMLLVLAVILFFNVLYSVYKKGKTKSYCFAGAMLGIAAGVKYNAVLLVFPFALVSGIACKDQSGAGKVSNTVMKFLMGCVVSIIAFCLVNPFMILDYSGFMRSVAHQSGAFWFTGAAHHLTYSLFEGISPVLAVTGIIGLIVLCVKSTWGKIWCVFPVLFYIVLVFRSQHFFRYVLPIIPFLAAGAGYLIYDVLIKLRGLRNYKIAVTVCSIVLLIPTTAKSVKADMLFAAEDTRIVAASWIKNNILEGSKIACDSTNFRPALSQPYAQLKEKKKFLDEQPELARLKERKLELQLKAADEDEVGFPVYFLFDDPSEQGQFLNTIPALPYDIDAIRAAGIKYLAINAQLTSKAKEEMLARLGETDIVAEFSPYMDGKFRSPVDNTATTCLPVSSKEVYQRKRPGPALKIYYLK